MADEIRISFDIDDIQDKSDSDKLDLLLKIAFVNHRTLTEHGKLLFGNGKEGICDTVRTTQKAVKAMWGLLFLVISGFIAMALR